ncbi:hypothetical protein [Streptomyces sp. CNZ748]|uniref:hypothetical protein n=1 Tax=Streptomyces sp. CNZ748 TaxID=2885160 RepID=UPI001E55D452|nr:hypothetical protein [Streptomyces sp. CNZ748]
MGMKDQMQEKAGQFQQQAKQRAQQGKEQLQQNRNRRRDDEAADPQRGRESEERFDQDREV